MTALWDRSGLRAGWLIGSPDVDPLAFVPVGRTGLRDFIERYVGSGGSGLSKFVVRPPAPVLSWTEEGAWLADAILDLQT